MVQGNDQLIDPAEVMAIVSNRKEHVPLKVRVSLILKIY
jgi:hypothetical protein